MGIQVEFNPDLALRNISEHFAGNRTLEECIPAKLEVGSIYDFLKKGQRNYWFGGEVPLLETKGEEVLSRPLASITILEIKHFRKDNQVFTIGKYRVNEVFDPKDPKVHFESYARKI